jgi:hypothetical protein
MKLKYIISILLITIILESIQSKCISNLTTSNTLLLDSSYSTTPMPITITTIFTTFTTVHTSATPFPIMTICTRSHFQIIPYAYLNLQAIKDFNITVISTTKLDALRQSVTSACASKCQVNTYCVYFKSYPFNLVNTTNCYLYQFKLLTTRTLKNNLQRGIYYGQDSYIVSGITKILFS